MLHSTWHHATKDRVENTSEIVVVDLMPIELAKVAESKVVWCSPVKNHSTNGCSGSSNNELHNSFNYKHAQW